MSRLRDLGLQIQWEITESTVSKQLDTGYKALTKDLEQSGTQQNTSP